MDPHIKKDTQDTKTKTEFQLKASKKEEDPFFLLFSHIGQEGINLLFVLFSSSSFFVYSFYLS